MSTERTNVRLSSVRFKKRIIIQRLMPLRVFRAIRGSRFEVLLQPNDGTYFLRVKARSIISKCKNDRSERIVRGRSREKGREKEYLSGSMNGNDGGSRHSPLYLRVTERWPAFRKTLRSSNARDSRSRSTGRLSTT